MPDSAVGARNPEFASLIQSLMLETERFQQAVIEKQKFFTHLSEQQSISLEDRKMFLHLLKMEQELYHSLHNLQEKAVVLLREENRR